MDLKRIIFVFMLFGIVVSCKKNESNDPDDVTTATPHYAYVKGIVVDSATGIPMANAAIYANDWQFYESLGQYIINSTDISGMYTQQIMWYVGDLNHNGTTVSGRPDDSTDIFILAFRNEGYGFVKFKAAFLIENDTIILPAVYTKPIGYISTHIKNITGGPTQSSLQWHYIIGHEDNFYYSFTDTIIVWKAYPDLKTYFSWVITNDSVVVSPNDTAFLDLFY
jgi:hypothetical protein